MINERMRVRPVARLARPPIPNPNEVPHNHHPGLKVTHVPPGSTIIPPRELTRKPVVRAFATTRTRLPTTDRTNPLDTTTIEPADHPCGQLIAGVCHFNGVSGALLSAQHGVEVAGKLGILFAKERAASWLPRTLVRRRFWSARGGSPAYTHISELGRRSLAGCIDLA